MSGRGLGECHGFIWGDRNGENWGVAGAAMGRVDGLDGTRVEAKQPEEVVKG